MRPILIVPEEVTVVAKNDLADLALDGLLQTFKPLDPILLA